MTKKLTIAEYLIMSTATKLKKFKNMPSKKFNLQTAKNRVLQSEIFWVVLGIIQILAIYTYFTFFNPIYL